MLSSLGVGAAQGQGLRAGYARADITPTEPVYMAGYDMRNAPSEGIHGNDRLYARALVLEAGSARVAFVEADVIVIRGADEWRAKISAATGIPVSHILLGDAHNHASTSPTAKLETNLDRQFEIGLLAAATEAVAALQPATVAAGTGHSRVGMNRRKVLPADVDSMLTFDENDRSQSFGKFKTDRPVSIHDFAGVVRLGANPSGPMDEAVQVVRIDTAGGKPLAVMIHYACHGTTLGGRNSRISGEWMGRMQEYVEKQFQGLGAIYLQGAAVAFSSDERYNLANAGNYQPSVHRDGAPLPVTHLDVNAGLVFAFELPLGFAIGLHPDNPIVATAMAEVRQLKDRRAGELPLTVTLAGDSIVISGGSKRKPAESLPAGQYESPLPVQRDTFRSGIRKASPQSTARATAL